MNESVNYNNKAWRKRLLIACATEGLVRFEWAHARYGQVIPVNWESSGFDVAYTKGYDLFNHYAVGFSIDDAYNAITGKAIELGVEWVIIVEDDVILPPDCFLQFAEHINAKEAPVVSGLYYLKAMPTKPLVFRGRGNGAYMDFRHGDRVWCDGVPMGCLLIHASLLQYMWDNSPEYTLPNGQKQRAVFETPRKVFIDPETGSYSRQAGTQDLYWCDRILSEGIMEKTGWTDLPDPENPFLVDTNIFCKHIDRNTGKQYP